MCTSTRDSIQEAYEEVRSDGSDINWAVFKYEGKDIIVDSTGIEYEEFREKFTEDDRAYGYVRVITGDELSKRAKFALICWIGHEVSVLKRAKVSTDKSELKQVIQSFAVELQPDELDDLDEDKVRRELEKAGGANYGTGERD